MVTSRSRHLHAVLLAIVLAALIWSGIRPADRAVWFMEVVPAIAGVIILAATYARHRLTDLVYVLVAGHCLILIVGGHYTYAEVPIGNWVRDTFHLARNHYDRLGHLAQGFVPAIIAREILLRSSPLRRGAWLFVLVTCFCLALSAFYELVEWWVAVSGQQSAEAFLGTQGDVWDTQWDMFCCLCGAIVAQLMLAGWHDRQLRQADLLPPDKA